MFRRAIAAIELGKQDWTYYWDLLLAVKMEPGNREISMKLEEIKSFLFKKKSNMHCEGDLPTDLGSRISSPNRKVKAYLEKKDSFEQDIQGNDSSSSLNEKDIGSHNRSPKCRR